MNDLNEQRVPPRLARVYLGLAALLAAVALFLLLRIPSEGRGALVFGLTPFRLLMAAGLLAVFLFFGGVLLWSWLRPREFKGRLLNWGEKLSRPTPWGVALLLSLIGLVGGAYALLLTPEISEPFTRAYYERMAPVFLVVAGLSLLILSALLLLSQRLFPAQLGNKWKIFLIFLLICALFFGLWSLVVSTQYRQESLVLGWNELGSPVLETQVLLAWVIAMLLLGLSLALKKSPKSGRGFWISASWVDFILAAALWLGAIIYWGSIPLWPSWFLSEPRPPNQEYYPNSDALTYDLSSQQLLVGEGFQFMGAPFARRPAHTLYLTVLHAIAGQKYEAVVLWQIAVLAFFPVLIYFMTISIHKRLSGLIAAILVLLREGNSIAMAGVITTSHAKLLMVDLPATMCVVCLVYVVIVGLKNGSARSLLPLLAGGLLGVGILIRVEFAAFAVTTLLIWVIFYWKRPFDLARNAVLLVLGLTLLLAPWIWRNYNLTGQIFLDSPTFRVEDILTNIQQEASEQLPDQPKEAGEIPGATQPAEANGVPAPASAPPDGLLGYLSANVGGLARYVFAHAFNSTVQAVLVLPTTFRLPDSLVGFIGHRDAPKLWEECCSAIQYPRRLPYWFQWNGIFPRQALVPLVLNLFLMFYGIFIAWRSRRLLGLVPLIFALTHILVMALIRKSGGRYILPADWAGILYYAIGLAAITTSFLRLLTRKDLSETILLEGEALEGEVPSTRAGPGEPLWRRPAFYCLALAILLLGCVLPAAERGLKPLYPEARKQAMLDILIDSSMLSAQERQAIELAIQEGGEVFAGRALYPRFFRAGKGEPGTRNPMGPLPFARFGFYLAGPEQAAFILPMEKQRGNFPNASDVVVVTGADGTVVAVGVFESPGKLKIILTASPPS